MNCSVKVSTDQGQSWKEAGTARDGIDLTDFVKGFRKKWKGKTNCRSGYITQDCQNAPKPKTTSTSAPGAVTSTTGQ